MGLTYQTKDYINLLACCCIKWDDSANGNFIPSWDTKKLHRLQSLLHITNKEIIEQAKYDIEFTNHWRIEEIMREYCSSIKSDDYRQVFFSALVTLASQSQSTKTQLKFDASIVKLLSTEFGFTDIKDTVIFHVAKSFATFTESISNQQ